MTTRFFGETAALTGRSLRHITRSADTIINAETRNDSAVIRYTEPFTVSANSRVFFSPKSLAKNGKEACPTAWPRTAIGTANRRFA